ncbi:MAG: methyltransferase [Chthoniobacteraceae bacterium]
MKPDGKNPAKELYQQLRQLSCEELWTREVPRFDRADEKERAARVGLVRAVGVVFSERGTEMQKQQAREWLRALLQDPVEKIRRYAMAALPKLGAAAGDEAALLELLQRAEGERERKFLGQTLEKIGGAATLEEASDLGSRAEQKIKASVARSTATTIRLERVLTDFAGLRVHLRGRRGLESMVQEEAQARLGKQFRVAAVHPGLVMLEPLKPFSLGDLYAVRCCGSVAFVLGVAKRVSGAPSVAALAELIASPLACRVLETFTEGPIRYRLDFTDKGHQRGAIRELAGAVYQRCPELLNDAREAPWAVEIHPAPQGLSVELTPRLSPDPRFAYRQQDVPAASHPPLAASMARLALQSAAREPETIWDPFCGSGLELIERSLLGGVKHLFGTDLSAEAIEITKRNLAAAALPAIPTTLHVCDFRDYARVPGLRPGALGLIISNPPLGRRVPIADLRGLIGSLFSAANVLLKPGGRLIFANPLRSEATIPGLKLLSRQKVDFGGFDCRVEVYVKTG